MARPIAAFALLILSAALVFGTSGAFAEDKGQSDTDKVLDNLGLEKTTGPDGSVTGVQTKTDPPIVFEGKSEPPTRENPKGDVGGSIGIKKSFP